MRKNGISAFTQPIFCLSHFKGSAFGLALAVGLSACAVRYMDVFCDAFVIFIIDAIARFTADMQGRIGVGTATRRDVACRTALSCKIRTAGLLASASAGACNLDIRAAAAILAIVRAACDGTS